MPSLLEVMIGGMKLFKLGGYPTTDGASVKTDASVVLGCGLCDLWVWYVLFMEMTTVGDGGGGLRSVDIQMADLLRRIVLRTRILLYKQQVYKHTQPLIREILSTLLSTPPASDFTIDNQILGKNKFFSQNFKLIT